MDAEFAIISDRDDAAGGLAVLLREDRKTDERAKGVKGLPKKGAAVAASSSFVRADYIGQIFQITPVPGI